MRLVIISALALLCTASFCQDINVPSGTISTAQQYETQGNITAASVQVSPPGRLDLKASGGIYLKSSAGQSVIISGGAGFTAKIVPAVLIVQPVDGSTVLTVRPIISATITSVIRHVDRTTLRLTLDGGIPFSPTPIQWTPVSSTDGGTFTFTPASDLSVGAHTLIVSVSDPAGNTANVTTHFSVGNQPPTIVTAAQANPNPTIGMKSTLSVLGADDGGAGNLSYAWTTTGNPPDAVTFIPNGNNAAQSTVASFSTPGTYDLLVTVSDVQGSSVTSAITVIVRQTSLVFSGQPTDTMTGLGISPPVTITFKDQNGNIETDVSAPITISLDTNPSGATLSGNLTSGAVNGVATFPGLSLNLTGSGYTLQASAGGVAPVVSSPFSVALSTNAQPTVENAATASIGATTNSLVSLSVLGADDGGESNLTYSWTVMPPAAVSFSQNASNSAKSTTAIFGAAGIYSVTVTISDLQLSTVTSLVTVNVQLDGPTNLSAVHQGNQIHLAWTDISTEETNYVVEKSIGFTNIYTQIALLPANTTSFNDAAALTDPSYFYRVKAINTAADSYYSNSASADWPLPPTNLVALGHAATQVLLVWNHSLLNVDNFIIERKDSPTGMFAPINPQPTGTPLQFIDTNVLSYNQYVYRVRAVKGAYPSDPSNEASITLSALPLVKVTTSTPIIGEQSGLGMFTISRTGDTSLPLSVSLAFLGNAIQNTNYQSNDSAGHPVTTSILIPAGATSASINIVAIPDNSLTGDLTVRIALKDGSGYALANSSTANLTIEDMDNLSYLPTASVSLSQSVAFQGISYTVFHIQSAIAPTSPISVHFGMSGSAIQTTNYSLWDASTYPAGTPITSNSVTVSSDVRFVDLMLVPNDTALHASNINATLTLLERGTFAVTPYYHVVPQSSATISLIANAPVIGITALAASMQNQNVVQNAFAVTVTNGNLGSSTDTITKLTGMLTPTLKDVYGASQALTGFNPTITYSNVIINNVSTAAYIISLTPPINFHLMGDSTIVYTINPSTSQLVYQIANPSAQIALKDNTPVVSLIVARSQADSNFPGRFIFKKQGTFSAVNFSILTGGDAANRTDYALCDSANNVLTVNTVSFLPGQDTTDVYVYPLVAEPLNKTVTLSILPASGIVISSPNQGTVTLLQSATTPPIIPPTPPLPPPPNCDNPLSATIQGLTVTGGTTGEGNGQFQIGTDSRHVFFTKNYSVSVSVSAAAINGTIDLITITGGSDVLTIPGNGSVNGVFTGNVNVGNEGIITLYASVSATNACGDTAGASLADGQEQIIVVDRTPPSLVYTLPDRHSATDNKELVYLNGSDEPRNAALRADKRSNCWNASDFNTAAIVSDLSGLRTGNSLTLATVKGDAQTVDLNVSINQPTSIQPNYTITVDPPPALPESITYGVDTQVRTGIDQNDGSDIMSTWTDPFKVNDYNGFYNFDIVIEDRCGNVLDSKDEAVKNQYAFKIWVDRTPPPAAIGTNNFGGLSKTTNSYNESKFGYIIPAFRIQRAEIDHTNQTCYIFSKNAWYVVSTPDAAEAWQDSVDPINWMHLAYHHPWDMGTQSSPLHANNGLAEDRSIAPWLNSRSALAKAHPQNLPHIPALRTGHSNKSIPVGNPPQPLSADDDPPDDPQKEKKRLVEGEVTPFILRNPVKNLNGGINDEDDYNDVFNYDGDLLSVARRQAPPIGVTVIVRDMAGNYSSPPPQPDRLMKVRRDMFFASSDYDIYGGYFQIDGDDDVQEPQYSDSSNFFEPNIMTVPPSFNTDPVNIDFTLHHPDFTNPAAGLLDEDPLAPESAHNDNRHLSYTPLVGIAPTAFERNVLVGKTNIGGLYSDYLYKNLDFYGWYDFYWSNYDVPNDTAGQFFFLYIYPAEIGTYINASSTTDLLKVSQTIQGTDQTSGTIPYTQDAIAPPALNGPYQIGDQNNPNGLNLYRGGGTDKWNMPTDMQPGLARTIDTTIHTGYHWANVVKLTPDVAATGNVVTLRIGGGFIKADKFDKNGVRTQDGNQSDFLTGETIGLPNTNGDYVHIGDGLLTKASSDGTTPNDPAKITILRDSTTGDLLQRLVPDPNEPSLLQWIELTVEIGANVQADLYDVNVNLGSVQNHTMVQALNLMKFEWHNSLNMRTDIADSFQDSKSANGGNSSGSMQAREQAATGLASGKYYFIQYSESQAVPLGTTVNLSIGDKGLSEKFVTGNVGDYKNVVINEKGNCLFQFVIDNSNKILVNDETVIRIGVESGKTVRAYIPSIPLTTEIVIAGLDFLNSKNEPYNYTWEALNISNWKVEDDLFVNDFSDKSPDPDNFRIQVVDYSKNNKNTVPVTLKNLNTGASVTYTLDKKGTVYNSVWKDGFRSNFLRLISQQVDVGKMPNQTVFAKLGDFLELSYLATSKSGATVTVTRSLPVGNTDLVDRNGVNQLEHTIMDIKVNFIVMKNGLQSGPAWTKADLDQLVNDANEVLAQSTLRLNVVGVNWGVNNGGVNPPQNVLGHWLTGVYESDFYDFRVFKSSDANCVDVVLIQDFAHNGDDGTSIPKLRIQEFAGPEIVNTIFIQHHGLTQHITLAHELDHILMNRKHTADGDYAPCDLFYTGNDPSATRNRIGPNKYTPFYPLSPNDTLGMRAHARNLPKP